MESHLTPDKTPEGYLPPFEVAKAYAFEKVLSQMVEHMGMSVYRLIGENKGDFIARHLELQGGGRPCRSSVFKAIKRCGEKGWYPGKVTGQRNGRPPMFSRHQKEEMARVAMDTKRKLERPTPARVRAKLPRLSLNPETEAPASDWTIYKVFHSMCYDESEDDPWIYLHSPSKDFLSDGMKTSRVVFADYILENFATGAWSSHVAIDPCISNLATTRAQSDEQRVAAMGVQKMMSPKSKYKGANLRAPKTVK